MFLKVVMPHISILKGPFRAAKNNHNSKQNNKHNHLHNQMLSSHLRSIIWSTDDIPRSSLLNLSTSGPQMALSVAAGLIRWLQFWCHHSYPQFKQEEEQPATSYMYCNCSMVWMQWINQPKLVKSASWSQLTPYNLGSRQGVWEHSRKASVKVILQFQKCRKCNFGIKMKNYKRSCSTIRRKICIPK